MVFNLRKNLFNKNSSATPSYPFFVEAILKEQQGLYYQVVQ